MDVDNIDYLKELSNRRVRDVTTDIKRYLYDMIDWRDRLIMIKGMRGVGKTTLMLQRIKEEFGLADEALYISLDNLWFADKSPRDVIEYHYLHGGSHIFIDEIHYYKEWQKMIKNIYDDFPKLNIVCSGSALLKLDTGNADLSRRQTSYTLNGLSFREYLEFEGRGVYHALSLEDVLNNHLDIAADITSDISVLADFQQYIYRGYYPFYKEVYSGYYDRLRSIINQVVENDYPAVEDVTYSTIRKMKKMLMLLAKNAPQTPNMSLLYKELETDRNQGLKMLNVLKDAGILNLLSSKSETIKMMSRPEKIYCNNGNIMAALVEEPNAGSVRESFFLNQMENAGYKCTYPEKGDFLADGKYLFEVGGRKKSYAQIKDIENSYLAVDGTEVGYGNRIPLWMFGLLY